MQRRSKRKVGRGKREERGEERGEKRGKTQRREERREEREERREKRPELISIAADINASRVTSDNPSVSSLAINIVSFLISCIQYGRI